MTAREHRLDRLSTFLTAKERALLVLRSWQEGKDEDPFWRWAMPDEQAAVRKMAAVVMCLRPH